MSPEKPQDAAPAVTKAESPDEPVQADADASLELTDEQLSRVAGGRVKTADIQQKAVLDFLKG